MKTLSRHITDAINKTTLSLLIVLSLGLLAFIAYDTINNIPFTEDVAYLHFQFWVCIVFTAIYFVSAAIDSHPLRYALSNILFLLISLPYYNIIAALHIELPAEIAGYLRYIPILRGAWAAIIITRYLTRLRMTSIFISYVIVIVTSIAFASLIVFDIEGSVNPAIDSYSTALWWSSMQTTTVGMPFDPVTPLGQAIAAVLSAMGMMMYPMFTAYLTAIMKKHYTLRRSNTKNFISLQESAGKQ